MPGFVKGKGARRVCAGLVVTLLLAAPTAGTAREPGPSSFDYAAYARVLTQFVTPAGLVRYAELKAQPQDLDIFLDQLAAVSPASHPERFPTPEARITYWINAYNAFTMHAVADAYPVGSVRDLRFGFGLLFFKRARFTAGGQTYSLDDIEHGILRKEFNEPRIHFAVNCASTSCPPLLTEPYTPERLDEQLDGAARNFIRQQDNVWLRGDVLLLSRIFDWYGADFRKWLAQRGAADPTVVDYVVRYLEAPVAEKIRRQNPSVKFYDYDWSLNDAAPATD